MIVCGSLVRDREYLGDFLCRVGREIKGARLDLKDESALSIERTTGES